MPRLFLFDPNLKSATGHYLGYATRMGDAVLGFGIQTLIVANQDAVIEGSRHSVLPLLRADYWQEMRSPAGVDPFDHLAASADLLADTLLSLARDCGVGHGDVLFFPYINLAEVMGLARWARTVRNGMPRTVLLFRRDLDEQGTDAGVGPRMGAGLLRQALADLCAAGGHARIRLFTDSDNLTEDYAEGTRKRFQTAPIPVDPRLSAADRPSNRVPPTVLYLGDARSEKGYQFLPAIAEALRDPLGAGTVRMVVQSNFNLPGGEPGIPEARKALETFPNVRLLLAPLSEDEYVRCLHESDLILLPYQADRYAARTSGILAEAICAGLPAVVPEGTWMADQLRRHGAGVAYPPVHPESPGRAAREALDRLAELRERALARRGPFAQFHHPSRLAQFVLGADVIQRTGAGG